jgi:hypothetical protein
MDYQLSDSDLKVLIPSVNIITYNNIASYSNIDEVLNGKPTVILFEMTENNSGHWTCMFKNNNVVYFYDSYGLDVEQEKKYMNKRMFKKANYLSRLLKRMPYSLDVNRTKYQEMENGINTCGRHVAVRIWNKQLNDEDYKEYIYNLCDEHKVNPDELVIMLTEPKLGK